jgi:hypothetical protein
VGAVLGVAGIGDALSVVVPLVVAPELIEESDEPLELFSSFMLSQAARAMAAANANATPNFRDMLFPSFVPPEPRQRITRRRCTFRTECRSIAARGRYKSRWGACRALRLIVAESLVEREAVFAIEADRRFERGAAASSRG